MERLFRTFSANRQSSNIADMLRSKSGRCKIHSIDKFRGPHWVIDRWWSRAEKLAAGVMQDAEFAEFDDVLSRIAQFRELLSDYDSLANIGVSKIKKTSQVQLGNDNLFRLFIGKRLIKKDALSCGIPIYSANVFEPMGFLNKGNVEDLSVPSILWGIDGNFSLNLIPVGVTFGTTDHCGTIQIIDKRLIPEYILYAIVSRRVEETFDRSFRPSLTNMKEFTISIPVDDCGEFDVVEQERIATCFTIAQQKRTEVENGKLELDEFVDRYLSRADESIRS